MFVCLLQKSFQENLYSWQDKFDTGIDEFGEYRVDRGKLRLKLVGSWLKVLI